jgi:hypothetical protein
MKIKSILHQINIKTILHQMNIMNIIGWSLVSIPTGYIMSILMNDLHVKLYKKNMSIVSTRAIMISIICFGFLKGYTGNDLVTNIHGLLRR